MAIGSDQGSLRRPQLRPAPPGSGTVAARRRPTIALIDDNPDILAALGEELRDRAYRVVAYRSGEDALRILEQGDTPSVIVLDLMMPGMDGWTFRLRQRSSVKLRDVPVIVMTACDSPQAEAIDADAYVRKPLTIERFCSVVEQTLAQSERRRLLARSLELESLRSLGMLTTSIAHEINNPLAYVSGMLELALRDCGLLHVEDGQNEVLTRMRQRVAEALRGATEITELVRSILVFARYDASKSKGADIHRALEGAVRIAAAHVRPRAKLCVNVPLLPAVRGDEARLGQVFLNLLMNAAQAIPPGDSEHHSITVEGSIHEGDVIVEVIDTGAGIAQENLPRVFDPFFTTKPHGEGTGLGLSVVKEIVEQLGGGITVRSRQGVGTTFRLRLPTARDVARSD